MRFRRLALNAFGPFTGVTLDLTRAQGNGLHLIYGPNEAGKSSALRAIRDLLFGMPQQSQDAHLHPTQALRLSAVIERDGAELSFVRRKKRKDSLAGPDDQPLDEARLARYLNGLDAASFERLFGLDHDRLQGAAEDMIAGRGDVGEALFDAGASGRSVHKVKLALVEEAEALFKDRAQKPELNRLLAVYADQKRGAKDSQHSPEKYLEQQEGVRDKRREVEGRRSELGRLRGEKEHVIRLRNVLSSVVERDRKSAQLAALGEVPVLRPGIGEERERASTALLEAEREGRRLQQRVEAARAKRDSLPEPSSLLGIPEHAVKGIERLIGGAQQSMGDLPKRQAEARALRETIVAKLPRLGLGQELDEVLSHALPVAEQARVQVLARDFAGLSLKLETETRELEQARAKARELLHVLERTRAARRIPREALLPREVVERFDGELGQAEERLEALATRAQEAERERASLQAELALLKAGDGVPSKALVAEARTQRDARLRECQELAADPKRKALELCLPLAALAQASAYADNLSDRLRSEAQRVAAAEALEQRLARLERERDERALANSEAEHALALVVARWEELAERLGSAELLPAEAARLLQEERDGWREVLHLEQEQARALSAESAAEVRSTDAERNLASWREQWQRAVAPLGLPLDAKPEQALALLGALGELASQRDKLVQLEERAQKIQRDIDVFAQKVREQTDVFAKELSPLPPPEAASRLLEAYLSEKERLREREAAEQELLLLKRELAAAEARRAEQRELLTALCQEAGVAGAPELAELEQRVLRARTLASELEQLDAHLAEVSEGEALDVLVSEARGSDKGAVVSRLLELDEAISALEEQCRELDRDVRELELGLRAYEGRAGADAAQELSATVARMAEQASLWARRKLAAAVLERVVERYRSKHQGPVLSRASELFSRLTLGRFSRLEVSMVELRLECIEAADGKGLELEQLSRGTRSQLFLALKLASLEQYLLSAPPLPLVLDDVLVEWDDERSRVALEVLAEFSERAQILLFTHHGRDVAAAESLGDARVAVHRLQPRVVLPAELGAAEP